MKSNSLNDYELEKMYAERWKISASFFYKKGYYSWMSTKVKPYRRILEIGCGVGDSTLQLASEKHAIIAVEKNSECIKEANALLGSHGLSKNVSFMEGDIVMESFRERILQECKVDAIVCWNPGTQMSMNLLRSYVSYMLEYGLTPEQINSNPASSYVEMMLWHVCKIAKTMGTPLHIIDRCKIVDAETANYYKLLGGEIGFTKMQCDALEAETISDHGVPLTVKGTIQKVETMPIVLVSVLFQ